MKYVQLNEMNHSNQDFTIPIQQQTTHQRNLQPQKKTIRDRFSANKIRVESK